jgi:hypothetical protein
MASMSEALTNALDTIAPAIDERTVLIIDVPVTRRTPDGTDTLTYAALYVAEKWYLTGDGEGPLSEWYMTTVGLFTDLAKHKGVTVELVTETDRVR